MSAIKDAGTEICSKHHKAHRTRPAWKRDILFLACILRMRTRPAVPYSNIVEMPLVEFPDSVTRLLRKPAPRDIKSNTRLQHGGLRSVAAKGWLEEYFKLRIGAAEQYETQIWKQTLELKDQVVWEVLHIIGLVEKGCGAMSNAEAWLQIKWRKEGDWRAGSEPLGRPERLSKQKDTAPGMILRTAEDIDVVDVAQGETITTRPETVEDLNQPPNNNMAWLERLKSVTLKHMKNSPEALGEQQQQDLCRTSHKPVSLNSTLLDPKTGEDIQHDPSQSLTMSCGGLLEKKEAWSSSVERCTWQQHFAVQLKEIQVMEEILKEVRITCR